MTNKATAPVAADTTSNADPTAKLLGDWSWRPEMQIEDPGYVYSARERGFWETRRLIGLDLPAMRSWSVKAYVGPVAPPKRIGG